MTTASRTPTSELVRETLRQADAPLALGAAIARAGRAVGAAISDAEGVKAVTDTGDGLGLPVVITGQGTSEVALHDAGNGTLTIDQRLAKLRKDGEAPSADDLISTLSALPVDGEYMCFWGQSVASALSFINDDSSIEVAFVGEGIKPRVCFRRLRNKAPREHLTPRRYHVMMSVMVEVEAEGTSEAWHAARDRMEAISLARFEVIDALSISEP